MASEPTGGRLATGANQKPPRSTTNLWLLTIVAPARRYNALVDFGALVGFEHHDEERFQEHMGSQIGGRSAQQRSAVRLRGPATRWLEHAWQVLAWLGAALLVGQAPAASADATVRDIRIAQHDDGVRVVVELSRVVAFRYVTLDDPPRLAIDLPEVAWLVPESEGMRQIGINGYRFGTFQPGVSRLVVDVAQPFAVHRVFELPGVPSGHRIVFDLTLGEQTPRLTLAGADPAGATGSVDGAVNGAVNGVASTQAVAPEQKVAAITTFKLPLKKPQPRVIVIDPGHGGVDPGAIGVSGAYEKDVVMAMARELRRQLEATGRYKVVMTRERDQIVRLRDRIQIARENEGELFLSLHADSLVRNTAIDGALVYTLSEKASTREAARLAAKENRADILAGVDLSNQEDVVTAILIDLAQRDTNNKSMRFADILMGQLESVTALTRRRSAQAGFVVLKSPDMPSVLVELGYLSNREDERRLTDPQHLAKLARALVAAIDDYFVPVAARG
jgi:N-acetylmuramoyl-L-alanine amidase